MRLDTFQAMLYLSFYSGLPVTIEASDAAELHNDIKELYMQLKCWEDRAGWVDYIRD